MKLFEENQQIERKHTIAELVGLGIAAVLGIPLLLLLFLIIWQILISFGFDVAPR
jgi:hypothetical protein